MNFIKFRKIYKCCIDNIYLYLCLCLFIFWVFFQILNPKSLSTGDTASDLFLYSQLISEKFTLLSKDFYYPTELRFLHSTTIYSIFFHIFSNFDYIRLFSNITMYIILLIAFVYIIKQYNIKNKYAFLAMFLFFIPLSNNYLYIGIISSFYLMYYAIYIIYFALLLKIVNTSSKKWLYIIVYSVLVFIASLNGIRVFIHIFVPLFCSSILLFLLYKIFYKNNLKASVNYIVYSFLGLIISFVGYIITEKVLRNIVNFTTYTQTNLYNFEISKKSFDNLIYHLKFIFSIFDHTDTITIISNIMIFTAILLFFYMVYYLVRYEKNIKIHFLLMFLLVAFIEQICTAYVFKGYNVRYVYQIMIFIPVIVSIYAGFSKQIKKHSIILVVFIISLVIHGGLVVYYTYSGHYNLTVRYYKPNLTQNYENIISYLKDNNLTFGYVDHWHGQLIYEMTNGEIETAIMHIKKCQLVARKMDTLVKYFDNTDLHQQVYFILTNKVNDYCKDKNTLLKEHNHQYKDKNYTVYILEKGEILKNMK